MTEVLKTVTLSPGVTTLQTLYTCPAATTATVKKLVAAGKLKGRVTMELTDVSASATRILTDGLLNQGQEAGDEIADLVLEAGDVLKVQVGVANAADFTLSVEEDTATAATDEYQLNVEPVATAGNDLNESAVVVNRAGVVSAVKYVPLTTITGANTDTRKTVLVNKGQAGAGSTVVATLQYNAGVNATGEDEKALTLSVTPSDLVVAAGDVLEWQSTHVGNGIADPGGKVHVTVTPT